MNEQEEKYYEELLYWHHWIAQQEPEQFIEIIFPLESPMMNGIYINLN